MEDNEVIQDDIDWLNVNGHHNLIDPVEFSNWVSRNLNDLGDVELARNEVIKCLYDINHSPARRD